MGGKTSSILMESGEKIEKHSKELPEAKGGKSTKDLGVS